MHAQPEVQGALDIAVETQRAQLAVEQVRPRTDRPFERRSCGQVAGEQRKRRGRRNERSCDEHARDHERVTRGRPAGSVVQGEADDERGHERDHELGLGQERQPQGDTHGEHDPLAAESAEMDGQKEQRNEGECGAVGRLVGVRRKVVVVAAGLELGEGEEHDQRERTRHRHETIADHPEQGMDGGRDHREYRDIGDHERPQPGPEQPEQQTVERRRQRSVEVRDVRVQPLTLGQLPRNVQLPAEIDQGVRPLSPAPDQVADEHRCQRERSDPVPTEPCSHRPAHVSHSSVRRSSPRRRAPRSRSRPPGPRPSFEPARS